MEVVHRVLTDGVELTAVSTNKFKTNILSVSFVTPLCAETVTANALIGEVLYRGSKNHPDIEALSAATDELYGMSLSPIVRQKGESQCVGFAASFLDDRFTLDGQTVLKSAAQLMAEIILQPSLENGIFREDYVRSEGKNLADLIRAQINEKRGWSIHRVTELMCEGEAYALDKYGFAEEAEAMTVEKLWTRYQTLLREARIIFYYSGTAAADQIEAVLRDAFAPLILPRSLSLHCQVVAYPKGEVRSYTDCMDVSQGQLVLGFRTGGITADTSDYPALMLCNAIYGGTATSKLFMNVREKLSLCYFAASMVDKLKGLMVVSSGVEFSNFEIAKREILHQLKAMQDGSFTEEDLDIGRKAIISSLRTMMDSHGRMEDFWLTQSVSGCLETPESLIEKVEKITHEQVKAAAGKLTLDTVYYLTGEED